MRKLIYPLMMATMCVATACTNTKDDVIDNPTDKTPISFSVDESHTPMTRAGFTKATEIAMRIKSKNDKDSVFTRAIATASEQGDNTYSSVSLTENRYWDDAFGRDANLSVYAIAVPNKSGISNNGVALGNKLTVGATTWFAETKENETVSWKVAANQTATTLDDEDLTYSNNIQKNGKSGVKRYDYSLTKPNYSSEYVDGCMLFTKNPNGQEGAGKFDQGHLVFTHALSRITVNLKKGDGFDKAPFEFTPASSYVSVLNVPVSGNLNLIDGKWSNVTKSNVTMCQQETPTTGYNYTLMAQMLPDYYISSTDKTNVLTFTIDNNKYYITQDKMYEALKDASGMTKKDGNGITMEQGLNYKFYITVNKTGVKDITATVQGWENVNANPYTPSNARIEIKGVYDSQSGEYNTDYALYRALDESPEISDEYEGTNWQTGYEKKGTDDWYYESNKSYYHFRTVTPADLQITPAATSSDNDYFTVTSGTTDYHWGAPMTDKPKYDIDNGYADRLLYAIGPNTNTSINITDMHIMSNLIIKLKSSATGGVDLTDCKVTITNFANKGTVLMGTGLVTPSTTLGDMLMNGTSPTFTNYVVPQSTANIGLVIETADGNKYIISDLSKIKTNDATNPTEITRWLPGSQYTYTFTLSKTGVSGFTCTVEGWKPVDGTEQPVSL